jgi:hypothetical protein
VGLVLRPDPAGVLGRAAHTLLEEAGFEPLPFPWPPRLDADTIARLRRCDWVLVDITEPAGEAVIAFLHGQFVPHLRLREVARDNAPAAVRAAEEVLFGGLEVGYSSDVVEGHTTEDLLNDLGQRLEILRAEPERISCTGKAIEYFESASKRKEAVFLSYAGADSDTGALFAREFERRFRDVFHYRGEDALEAGVSWVDQIFGRLSATAIGVLFLSANYTASRNCLDEAEYLYSAWTNHKAILLPVRLDRSPLPEFLKNMQYARAWEHSPAEIVQKLLDRLS